MGIEVASSFTRKSPVPLDDLSVVADLTARDAIASGVRYQGMKVTVLSNGKEYKLIGGITNFYWIEMGGGGGNGGGGIIWRPHPQSGAVIDYDNDYFFQKATFTDVGEKITATLKVNDTLTAQKLLKIVGYPLQSSVNYRFKITAYLHKLGQTLSNANFYTFSHADVAATATAPDQFTLPWTDSSGQINSQAIGAGDTIVLEIEKIAATTNSTTNPTVLILGTEEVLDV